MASGVTRRGDSWRARYPHPETHKQIQATFKRQVDAQRWLREQLAALDANRWIDPRAGRVTFAAYFTQHAERQIWTDCTHKAMSLAVRSTTFGEKELRTIRPTHVEVWVKGMSVNGLAAGTVKTRFVNVRSVFRAAVRDKLIASDPTEGVRLPRQRRADAAMTIRHPGRSAPSSRHPTSGSGRSWPCARSPDQRFRAFVAVCALAGLRLGEAAALQVADVDFLRRQISVQRQVQRATGGAVEIRLPKYGSERVVPIPDELSAILSAHVALGHRGSWLFQGAGDTPPHQNTVGYWWRKTLADAGLEGVRLHDLRHFYASGLIAAACDVVTVQRALGHAKSTTTLDTYSQLWPSAEDKTRKAAATLAGKVLGADVGRLRARGVP